MSQINEVESLSDFQRDAHAYLRRIVTSGNPLRVAIDDAAVVIQDDAGYQRMVDQLEELRLAVTLLEGEASIRTDGVVAAEEVWAGLEKKFGL